MLLAGWEGIELKAYRDVAGYLTIGVGHLLTKDELTSGKIWIRGIPLKYANGLTHQQVMDLLGQDLEKFEQAVTDSVVVPLTQNQFDALVAFSFNVGVNAFKNSTLVKLLNQGQYHEVPNQLRRWIYAGGQILRGMVQRREYEIMLWNA